LKVSYLGYRDKVVEVIRQNAGGLEIHLQPSMVVTQELTVTDDYEIKVVEKAIDRLLSKIDNRIYGKAFYRQLTRSDSIYTEFIETFYNSELSNNSIERWKIVNGRYAVVPYDSLNYTIYHTNFSVFSRVRLVDRFLLQTDAVWPLNMDTRKYYNFYLKKSYQTDGEHILMIDFEKKNRVRNPGFEGTVAITDSSYTILGIEAKLEGDRLNLITPLADRAETDNTVLRVELSRDHVAEGIRFPNMIKVDLNYDYIKKKGIFGKIDFKREVNTQSILFYYEYEEDGLSRYLSSDYFQDLDLDEWDYRLIDRSGYRPEYWEDNPIIKRTPVEENVIESFEKYGSFGKIFNRDPAGN